MGGLRWRGGLVWRGCRVEGRTLTGANIWVCEAWLKDSANRCRSRCAEFLTSASPGALCPPPSLIWGDHTWPHAAPDLCSPPVLFAANVALLDARFRSVPLIRRIDISNTNSFNHLVRFPTSITHFYHYQLPCTASVRSIILSTSSPHRVLALGEGRSIGGKGLTPLN